MRQFLGTLCCRGGGRCCTGELREPHPRHAGDAFHAITTDLHDTMLRWVAACATSCGRAAAVRSNHPVSSQHRKLHINGHTQEEFSHTLLAIVTCRVDICLLLLLSLLLLFIPCCVLVMALTCTQARAGPKMKTRVATGFTQSSLYTFGLY